MYFKINFYFDIIIFKCLYESEHESDFFYFIDII